MTIFIPVIILILVALFLGLLQFSPGLFTIFYHYALGKYSRSKADNLSLDFILGAETINTIIWFTIYAIFFITFYHNPTLNACFIPWVIAGIILIEAIYIFFCYYRKGSSTALFVSRSATNTLTKEAKQAKTRKDAFLLGFFSEIPELIFTLPLYILIVYILIYSTFIPTTITIILFVIISTFQLFIIRLAFRAGHNLASIQRFRTKFKPLIRLVLSISLILLAIAITYLGVTYNG